MDFTLKHLATPELKPHEKPTEDVADARHRSMMEAIAPFAKKTEQKNLTPVYVDYKTRNTKLVLVLCPEWSPYMPPFSLARLSGVAKSAGYETTIIDLNVKAYRAYRDDWEPNKKLPFRLWDPSASWHWLGDTYMNDIHPVLEPILSKAVDDIIEMNPHVVGFSVYYISEEPTKWMCQEIKRRAPHIKIAVGGPNVHKSWFKIEPYYDFARGDVRARYRRVPGVSGGVLLRRLFESAAGGALTWEELRLKSEVGSRKCEVRCRK